MGKNIYSNSDQTFLLPPSLDDWVAADHPARFVRYFVDSLALEKLGFIEHDDFTGRPRYSNELLLKLLLYGYLNNIRSSRKLERFSKNDMGMLWLTGMKYPDHNTIWRFIERNRDALKAVFSQSVKLAIKMNMVGLVVQAVDGTKIAADVSRAKTLDKLQLKKLLLMLEDEMDDFMDSFDIPKDCEHIERYGLPTELHDRGELIKSIRKHIELLEREDTNHLNTTDPDARMIKEPNGIHRFNYNAQAVVDRDHGIVVGADVVNDVNDERQLNKMINNAKQNTDKSSEVTVADAGYSSGEELEKAERSGENVIANVANYRSRNNPNIQAGFEKSNFVYDSISDTYICPIGHELTFRSVVNRKGKKVGVVYQCHDYLACPKREQCGSSASGRRIFRSIYAESVNRQREKHLDKYNLLLLHQRKAIVEPVFGTIKRNMKFRRWDYRGLKKVQTQWSLICTTLNLSKIYKLWNFAS